MARYTVVVERGDGEFFAYVPCRAVRVWARPGAKHWIMWWTRST